MKSRVLALQQAIKYLYEVWQQCYAQTESCRVSLCQIQWCGIFMDRRGKKDSCWLPLHIVLFIKQYEYMCINSFLYLACTILWGKVKSMYTGFKIVPTAPPQLASSFIFLLLFLHMTKVGNLSRIHLYELSPLRVLQKYTYFILLSALKPLK